MSQIRNNSIITVFYSSANVSLNLTTRSELPSLLSDKNVSTCVLLPPGNNEKVVSELHVRIPNDTVQEPFMMIGFHITGGDCNSTLTILQPLPVVSSCGKRNIVEETGEFLSAFPNSGACYILLPIDCEEPRDAREFNGFLAIHNAQNVSLKLCEIMQA